MEVHSGEDVPARGELPDEWANVFGAAESLSEQFDQVNALYEGMQGYFSWLKGNDPLDQDFDSVTTGFHTLFQSIKHSLREKHERLIGLLRAHKAIYKSEATGRGFGMITAQAIERAAMPETETRWITIVRDDDSMEFEEEFKLSYLKYLALKKAAATAGKSMLAFLWDAAMPHSGKPGTARKSRKVNGRAK